MPTATATASSSEPQIFAGAQAHPSDAAEALLRMVLKGLRDGKITTVVTALVRMTPHVDKIYEDLRKARERAGRPMPAFPGPCELACEEP